MIAIDKLKTGKDDIPYWDFMKNWRYSFRALAFALFIA
jgi:hypothetical protein